MRRFTPPAIAIMVALAVTACGAAKPYPTYVQAAYINSCIKAGSPIAECKCGLSYIERHQSFTQLVANTAYDKKYGRQPEAEKTVVSSSEVACFGK
jgi:hypothetical protein